MKQIPERWIYIEFIIHADTFRRGWIHVPDSIMQMHRQQRIDTVKEYIREKMIQEGIPIRRDLSGEFTKDRMGYTRRIKPEDYDLQVITARRTGTTYFYRDIPAQFTIKCIGSR